MEKKRKKLLRYEGYEIDENGIVWSSIAWRGKGNHKIVAHPNNYGYLRVTLKLPTGKFKTEFVHNLMCENYFGNKNGLQIRHLDGDKTNNALNNLKLGTAKENAADRDNHQTTAKGDIHSEIICLRKENFRLKRELSSPLIASAPELLAALIPLYTFCDCTPEGIFDDAIYKDLQHLVKAAKEAINKATL